MKKRTGFVSNSSSSSFIIINNENLIPEYIKYVKLNDKQKARLVMEGFIRNIDDDIYLTQFVEDDNDYFYNSIKDDNYELKKGVIEYHSGGHGTPYNIDSYEEIEEDVFLYTGEPIYIDGESLDDIEKQLDDAVENLKRVIVWSKEQLRKKDEE